MIINKPEYVEMSEIVREKGTNRSRFFRGQVDKYTWVELGSSYLPSDMIAAYLYPQLLKMQDINAKRISLWNNYNAFFEKYEKAGLIRRPFIPADCTHNAHMYYLRFNDLDTRTKFISFMKERGIICPFHYIPLHSSPAGQKCGRAASEMNITDKVSDTLVRLPLYYSMDAKTQNTVLKNASDFLDNL